VALGARQCRPRPHFEVMNSVWCGALETNLLDVQGCIPKGRLSSRPPSLCQLVLLLLAPGRQRDARACTGLSEQSIGPDAEELPVRQRRSVELQLPWP
jgi:hypothetical protein